MVPDGAGRTWRGPAGHRSELGRRVEAAVAGAVTPLTPGEHGDPGEGPVATTASLGTLSTRRCQFTAIAALGIPRKGVGAWNAWRLQRDIAIDLNGATLRRDLTADFYVREGPSPSGFAPTIERRRSSSGHPHQRQARDAHDSTHRQGSLTVKDFESAAMADRLEPPRARRRPAVTED